MKTSVQKEDIISHRGPVEFDTIGDMISLLKERMMESKVKQVVYKKVLMMTIESLENVLRYNDVVDRKNQIFPENDPQFSVVKLKDRYEINCSNAVRFDDVKALKTKLDQLVSLDKEGVRALYKKRITNGQFSEKGGAGLGIIEMAKLSDEGIGYQFDKIDDEHFLYKLKLVVYYT